LNKEKILVTAALPYANGPIHLGHLAGAYLPADIFVRYNRLKGNDILFVCGSDEHGVPITITADKEGLKPKDIIDRFHEINKTSFEKFGMNFDIYSRTSLPIHHQTGKEFFLKFHEQGLLKEKKTLQFYDEKANMFLPDRYVEGTCPNCGNENARSDECESCGALYEPSALKNPISKISGNSPVLKETSHWFFPLGKFQERLEAYIKEMDEKFHWKENVLQYCRSWFNDGLQDRAVTRDLDWGIPVPLDEAKGKVLYVWFEAVLGYISAAKELSEKREESDLWKTYWHDEKTKYVAFIGKDNVVFHTIFFPAMLMAWNDASEDKFVLPQNVPANEFYNFEGKKFSKSRNWGIDVIDFLNAFPPDPLRYTLAANLPEMRDTDFRWKDFQARNNNELSAILGNFINRTFTFAAKNFEGKVPAQLVLSQIDKEMLTLLEGYPAKVSALFENYKIKDATLEIMNLARAANKYFNDSEPWKTIKSDRDTCSTTLNICLQTIFTLAELVEPIIPFSSQKIFSMLNARPVAWDECGKQHLSTGHQLNECEILFKKIEDEALNPFLVEAEPSAIIETKKDKPEAPDELLSIEDFQKVQLKVAEVLEAEKVAKSEKLLKLKVAIGTEQRQILAGIAKQYSPEEIVGKKVIVVANLKPAKLMGMESQGMVLAVEGGGKLHLLQVDPSVPSGTRAK